LMMNFLDNCVNNRLLVTVRNKKVIDER
jgi:hypothetical protein